MVDARLPKLANVLDMSGRRLQSKTLAPPTALLVWALCTSRGPWGVLNWVIRIVRLEYNPVLGAFGTTVEVDDRV
jgi:hypothetical protein